ncbi:hypothetical protein ACOUMD_17620 [Acinetobacter baumannii]|uniref:hypothetical protein n=1 Tax=Acinetobacter baumannii TaxID=470 RepID=UPI00044C741F|nr:hypothetical protein [Acinetobacter baumannii]EXA86743.1 hypothetical protein J517_1888 [Acinetobacter baumannii 118362]MDC5445665.1 hypothetical protein [Acinetobacter baumannii]HEO1832221.1 hypothetical protein [Acinetobacter baumannii]
MSKEQKVIYEPHPVSPERKAELRGQGYKIIDAVFKPEEEQAEKRNTRSSAQPKE